MRRLKNSRAYRVEVAPAVWRDVGSVPGDHFKRMQAELENVAQLIGLSGGVRDPDKLHRVRVDEYEGVYEVDPVRQTVRLMSVHRSSAPRR